MDAPWTSSSRVTYFNSTYWVSKKDIFLALAFKTCGLHDSGNIIAEVRVYTASPKEDSGKDASEDLDKIVL
jgi:hypothetical protein